MKRAEAAARFPRHIVDMRVVVGVGEVCDANGSVDGENWLEHSPFYTSKWTAHGKRKLTGSE